MIVYIPSGLHKLQSSETVHDSSSLVSRISCSKVAAQGQLSVVSHHKRLLVGNRQIWGAAGRHLPASGATESCRLSQSPGHDGINLVGAYRQVQLQLE
jgi:hypothetical protein